LKKCAVALARAACCWAIAALQPYGALVSGTLEFLFEAGPDAKRRPASTKERAQPKAVPLPLVSSSKYILFCRASKP